jgi:hypothetical protein
MIEMKALAVPEFHRLDGCLQGMSGLLSQGQLDWYFDAKGFEVADADFSVEDVIKLAYPGTKPENSKITECSVGEMVDELNRQLSVEHPYWGDPTRTSAVPLLNNDAAMWRLLQECVDYEAARVFRYEPLDADDELRCGITGEFAFLIYEETRRRCVLISGYNMD